MTTTFSCISSIEYDSVKQIPCRFSWRSKGMKAYQVALTCHFMQIVYEQTVANVLPTSPIAAWWWEIGLNNQNQLAQRYWHLSCWTQEIGHKLLSFQQLYRNKQYPSTTKPSSTNAMCYQHHTSSNAIVGIVGNCNLQCCYIILLRAKDLEIEVTRLHYNSVGGVG